LGFRGALLFKKIKGNIMTSFITETEIKEALERGLITSKEAREMLLVYVRREDFTPIVNKTITLHQVA